ncbi:hypothetical protein HS088_TW22G00893 [Tripterygium wilfordii]|uniref:Uncharacterized protein n=1 Tax=Tripterygium wilfordii TaxID=458696 RepID=A0A7J7BZV4_TRIWF|nr:hypothetical protein HS088_TW22G00893 [Tripterygium wilfordii]
MIDREAFVGGFLSLPSNPGIQPWTDGGNYQLAGLRVQFYHQRIVYIQLVVSYTFSLGFPGFELLTGWDILWWRQNWLMWALSIVHHKCAFQAQPVWSSKG